MAPGLLLCSEEDIEVDVRPIKRSRFMDVTHEDCGNTDSDLAASINSHPLGVKPSGNVYTSSVNSKDSAGNFRWLPDELLFQLLEQLDADALVRLGSTCRLLYAFTRTDELWRALFVQSSPSDFRWHGTWRATYLRLPNGKQSKIACSNVFSDVVHRPFFCTYTPLKQYAQNIPQKNKIPRMSNLTVDEYSADWTNRPFILTSPVQDWPAYKNWNLEYLLKHYGDVEFRAESVDWPLKTYVEYMKNSLDESPLYLFDRSFAEKTNIKIGRKVKDAAYWQPECFGEDLFVVLGEQRPDHRWLIIGPERGGSTFHKDPNATSAWNAPLTGSKYWLMFPSGPNVPPPPGVILSDDQSEITSPLSIAEYLLSFHAIARATPGCREGICHAGEILHVPSGWFHLVLNLEDSIALTENFVPVGRLKQVLRFLRDSQDQASGFKDEVTDPYELFVERLREKHPELLDDALGKLDGKKGRWEQITKQNDIEDESTNGGGFSFGFGGGEDDEDIP